jgi:hypothetical protein
MDYYDFIEKGLDVEIGQGLEREYKKVTIKKLLEFSKDYLKETENNRNTFVKSRRENSFYRPLFDERFLGCGPEDGISPLIYLYNPTRMKSFTDSSDAMYSMMIFSDEVIIKDPLPYYLTFFYGDEGEWGQKDAVGYILTLLKWLRSVRPLYELGRIGFYNGRIGQEKRFSAGSTINLYDFQGDSQEETMSINSYLDRIDEMHHVSENIDSDIYINSELGFRAYEWWSNKKNKAIRESHFNHMKVLNNFMSFNFPIYSFDMEGEFVKILENEDSVIFLRNFLNESVKEIRNYDFLSNSKILGEITDICREKVNALEKDMSKLTSVSESSFRFKLYKSAIDFLYLNPKFLVEFAEIDNKRKRLKSHIKTVGYVSRLGKL